MNNNIIGEVTVEVKAGLSVDEHTFRTCMDLIAIHFKNAGLKGVILSLPQDGKVLCDITPILTEEGLGGAFDGLYNSKESDGEC